MAENTDSLKTYTYRNYKTGTTITIESTSILEADLKYGELTQDEPKKCNYIGCSINDGG